MVDSALHRRLSGQMARSTPRIFLFALAASLAACGDSAPPPAATAPTVAAGMSEPPAGDAERGERTYRQACAYCHDSGAAGAPKLGDAAAWSPRRAQGMDALYAAALEGKGAMPARGGNHDLATASVKAAVDYLLERSR